MFRIALKTCADLEGGQGLPTTTPLESHNAIGFVSIPGKLKMSLALDALSTHQLKTVVKSWTPSDPLSGSAHGSDDSKE